MRVQSSRVRMVSWRRQFLGLLLAILQPACHMLQKAGEQIRVRRTAGATRHVHAHARTS